MSDAVISIGTRGQIRGTREDNGVCRFLGLPYAQAPVGSRRWKRPEPLPEAFSYENADGPRDCTEFGNICPQETYILGGAPYNDVPAAKYSEDCLVVNVWAPEKPSSEKSWPVLVYIHGGWLQVGDPSVHPKLHPHELISTDGAGLQAVVVSIGYRLGVFGFLAGEDIEGNFGFWDQRAALCWIQDHIQFFGGDPSRVTLFGHSAGAFSAHVQLQYELLHTDGSRPLFKGVFLCSNAIPAQPKSRTEANSQLQDLCSVLGIPTTVSPTAKLEALRKLPEQDLVAALPKLKMSNFRAATDNVIIHADMTERFKDGTFARIFRERGYRLLIGETETEQHLYSQWLPPQSEADLPAKLQNYYSAGVTAKLLAHPGYRGEAVDVFSRIVSDMQVRAPIRILCRQLREAGVPPERVMRYRVAFRPGFFDDGIYPAEAGVTHGADLYMWWAVRRSGYTAQEWDALKAWLSGSLAKLVHGQDFPALPSLQSYLLFDPRGEAKVVEDQYYDKLMSVMEAISK